MSALPSAAAGDRSDPEQRAWRVLARVLDPEIPVLTLVDLGVVRYVRHGPDGRLHIGLTPTYSGCPATEAIRAAARAALDAAGLGEALIEEVLAPAWTSDWLTGAARRKLAAYGIAPPVAAVSGREAPRHPAAPRCPRCGSAATERLSEFGSTPCKAHYRCSACREPFDSFKCI